MKLQLSKTLLAALPLVGGLWFAPVASAYDGDNWWDRTREAFRPSYSDPYSDYRRDRYDDSDYRSGRYSDSYDWSDRDDWRDRDEHAAKHDKLEHKYDKRMDKLERREQKALGKAYRKHDGNVTNPRFQERQGEIAKKYAHKRNKVERKFDEKHEDYHD